MQAESSGGRKGTKGALLEPARGTAGEAAALPCHTHSPDQGGGADSVHGQRGPLEAERVGQATRRHAGGEVAGS